MIHFTLLATKISKKLLFVQESVVYFEVEDQMRLVGNEPQAYFMVNEDGTVEKAPAPQGRNIFKLH